MKKLMELLTEEEILAFLYELVLSRSTAFTAVKDNCPTDILSDSFTWSCSMKGYAYWSKVYKKL